MSPKRANLEVPYIGFQTVLRVRESLYNIIDIQTRVLNFTFIIIIVIVVATVMKGNMSKENPFRCFSALSRAEPERGEGGWIKLKGVNTRANMEQDFRD